MLKGCFTALVTPFTKDHKLDRRALEKLIEFQVTNGISGVLAVGTTGESPTLDWQEHNDVTRLVCEGTKGKCKSIAGTGSNSTRETLEGSEHAAKFGADAVLVVDPYYNGPSSLEIRREYVEPVANLPADATAPVNATFKSDGKKAWAELGKMGRELDVEGTMKALTAAALKSSKRTVAVAVAEVEPELTAKKAEEMGIHTALATYKTVFDCPPERQQNVRVTTQYADKIMAPGEVYNFDKQIGPRTEERGFALAPGIVGKGELEDVLGGGICQVSTTLFNAVFEAGLAIIERHNHSLYIDHYPPGRDATVTDSLKTLKFRNDTDHYIWVHGWSNGIVTIFTIYGTDDGRKVEWSWSGWEFGEKAAVEKYAVEGLSPGRQIIERAGQDERSCTVTRTVTMPDGTILHNGPETYKSEFKMISRIIQVGAQPTTTTTTLPPEPPMIEEGDDNETVAAFQYLLNCNGFGDLTVDGNFGPATREAVEAAQRNLGRTINGAPDEPTFAELSRGCSEPRELEGEGTETVVANTSAGDPEVFALPLLAGSTVHVHLTQAQPENEQAKQIDEAVQGKGRAGEMDDADIERRAPAVP